MRRKRKGQPDAPLAPVPAEILDQFVRQGPISPEELDAAVRRFKKAIIERALGGELTHHLGYPAGGAKPDDTTNHRNGTGAKTILTDDGPLAIDVPRDREGTFEPQLIPKHERRFTGFDDKILALYARGMTVREIQGFLAEMYEVEVSPDLISTVTDSVVAEVTAWQSRPLEAVYPVVFFDALRVKIRDEAVVRSKAIYLALAILPDGTPGPSTYADLCGDLVARCLRQAGLGHARRMVVNDAVLAAQSVRLDPTFDPAVRTLVLTLGFGVGAAVISSEA